MTTKLVALLSFTFLTLVSSSPSLLAQTGPTPGGAAAGDLCANSTYPAPTVCGVNGNPIPINQQAVATNSSGQFVGVTTTGTSQSVFSNNPVIFDPYISTVYGGTLAGSDVVINGTSSGSPSNANVFVNTNGQFTTFGAATVPPSLVTITTNTASTPTATSTTARSTVQLIGKDGDLPGYDVDSYGTYGPYLTMRHAQGTAASPTATANNDYVFQDLGYGYDATNGFSPSVAFLAMATQAWTSTVHGTQLSLSVTANGSTTLIPALTLLNSGQPEFPYIPSATAADTGSVCYNSSTGNLTYNPSSTCLVSSARFKHNIHPFHYGLATVLRLHPVRFNYNETNAPHIGLIAEQVDKVDPGLVARDKDGKPNAVETLDLVSVLVKAVQEQQSEIMELKRSVAKLQASRMSQLASTPASTPAY